MNRFLVLDFLDCISLRLAGGNKVEGGFGAEVLEVLAGAPAGVHFLDVGGGEGVGGGSALGGKLDVEAAQRSKVSSRTPLIVPLENGELWSATCWQNWSRLRTSRTCAVP